MARRIALGAFLVLACADSPSPVPQAAQQRDSSGITIVENGPSAPALLFVNPTSAHIVGGDEVRFTSLVSAAFLSNGNIVIADSSESSVRLFDSTGRFVRNLVQKGGVATQQKSSPRLFATAHDSVYLVDGRAIIVFAPNGDMVRRIDDFDMRPDSVRERSTLRGIIGVLDDGSVITEEESFDRFATEDPRQVALGSMPRGLVVYRRGMPGDKSLVEYAEQPSRRQRSEDGKPALEGKVVSFAAGDQLFYSTGDTLSFQVSSRDGKLQRVVRVARPRVAIPTGRGKSFIPDVLGFSRDDSGRLWVKGFEVIDRDKLVFFWHVFSREGILESEVHSKKPINILAVRGDRVLGGYSNADHIQLALFTLQSAR